MPRYVFSIEEYYRYKSPKTLELQEAKDNWKAVCPFCNSNDKEGKFYVKKDQGVYYCFHCEVKGTMVKYHAHFAGISEEEAYAQLVQDSDVTLVRNTSATIPDDYVNKLHQALLTSPVALEEVKKRWLFTQEAIEHFKIGIRDGAITFPVKNKNGAYANIRFKKLWWQPGEVKAWNYTDPQKPEVKFSAPRLYPFETILSEDEIFLVAGEKDLLSTWSKGIRNVITTTHGEGTFPPTFAFDLAGKTVHVVYDNDRAGVIDAKKVYEELKYVAKVDIVMLPQMKPYDDEGKLLRKDLTDFWKLGYTTDDFQKFVQPLADRPEFNYFKRDEVQLPDLLSADEQTWLKDAIPNAIDLYTEYGKGRVNSPGTFHRLCGIWVMSNLLGRNCINILGGNELFANIWCFILGQSTKLYKSSVTETAKRILEEIDSEAIGTTSFTPQGLIKRLSIREDKLTTGIYFDEIAKLFDQIKSQEFMAGVREDMIKIMNNEALTYDRSRDEVSIKKSYATLIGSGIPSKCAELLTWRDIESGFLIRFLVCIENVPLPFRPMTDVPTYEQELLHLQLVNECRRIRNRWSKPWSLPLRPGLVLVPDSTEGAAAYRFIMNKKALDRFNQFDYVNRETEVKNYHVNLAQGRLPFLLRKLSTIYAAIDPYTEVFGNTVEINLEHVLLGIRDLSEYRNHMVELVQSVGLTDNEKQVNSIIDMVYRHPRITRKEIARELRISKKELTGAIETCLDRGIIRVNKLSSENEEYLIATL